MKTSEPIHENSDLHQLFVDQLRDILWAERRLLDTLPKMAKKATLPELKKAFEEHCSETEQHVSRIEKVLKSFGLSGRGKKCEAMAGLLEEGDELCEEFQDSDAADAALITAAQKVEHYEIATYGTLCAFASRLGYDSAKKILAETLKEETEADGKLSKIAMEDANAVAA